MECKQRGHFPKKYSRRKPEVFTQPALESENSTDFGAVNSGQSNGATTPAGNSPLTSTHKGTSSSSQSQEINEEINKQVAQAESKVNTNPTEAQKEAGKTIRFRSIRPGESLTDYARAVVANSPETRFRALGTTRLNKYKVEKIFGGIWIRTKKEFAKFASAVENYAFEEDGEGIAYTDNFLYAYYWNIDGQPIPYASVYLNREQSQDIVNQVNQEIKDGRKDKRAKEYIDSAIEWAWISKTTNNVNNGNNNSLSNRARHGRLGSNLLRKGRYYDNPSLYVKTQRPDNSQQLTSTPTEDRPTLASAPSLPTLALPTLPSTLSSKPLPTMPNHSTTNVKPSSMPSHLPPATLFAPSYLHITK